jgi:UDP-N-acetyl-alpha-D-quinovosamine dehydrogenase
MMSRPTGISPRVLVTGSNGFIGQHLQQALADNGFDYRGAVRSGKPGQDSRACIVGDIGPSTDWSAALDGIDTVVHLAGRAHLLRGTSTESGTYFRRVNAEGTAALVRAAVLAGVRRFVYVSSIKVLGGETGDTSFDAASTPRPCDDYARSKLEGEIAARSAASARFDVVVVRLPLVYGPGVRANFLRLLHWVDKEWPLPLGAVDNRRSLVSVWNLCDLVVNMVLNPAAPGGIWLVSDGEDLSTPQIIRRIAHAMGRRVRLAAVPVALLQLAGRLTGRQEEIRRLCGSLTVDMTRTRDELKWLPPVSVDESLKRTADRYLARGRSIQIRQA